jgi:hypothetical protein
VRAENLDPGVSVMQSTNQGMRHDAPDSLNRARDWRYGLPRGPHADAWIRAGARGRRYISEALNELNGLPPGSPWQNPLATIRRECVDHIVLLGEAHLRRILRCELLPILRRSRRQEDPPDHCASQITSASSSRH